MKKAMIMLLLLMIPMSLAQISEKGELQVTFVNQEPDPVGPGEYVDIRLQIANGGDEALNDVQVEIMPAFPFTLDPSDNKVRSLGTLEALQIEDRAVIIKYRLIVNSDAVEGINTFKVRVKDSRSSWASHEFDINVRTSDANLGIESVQTTPSPVEPGKDATITIKVKNLADSLLKEVSLNLDLTLASLTTITDLDQVPFVTMDSGTEKRIKQLKPGEEHYFTYKIRAYPTADSRVYKIPIILQYQDQLNTEYTQASLIGVVVNSEPDISIVLDDTGETKAGTKTEVSIRFINKGLTDVKFVDVIIKDSEQFDLMSSEEVYLGNIDSDDYDTADFNIYIDQSATDSITIPVRFEYMDANNNKYEIEKDLEMKIFSEEEINQLGNGNDNQNVKYGLIGLAIVVLLFIVYRVYRRCKKC